MKTYRVLSVIIVTALVLSACNLPSAQPTEQANPNAVFTAAAETDPGRIRQLVARNLGEPVRWRSCMEQLRAANVTALFEIGPGRVLSGLARANGFGDETRVCNVNNLRGVELAAAEGL